LIRHARARTTRAVPAFGHAGPGSYRSGVRTPDDADAEALTRATLRGDPRAFARLSLLVWPLVQTYARRSQPRDAEEVAQELYARLLERLEAEDFAALRTYEAWRARHPEKGLADWVRIVVANLSRDWRRERVGRRPAHGGSVVPSAKRILNEIGALMPLDDLSYRPRITSAQTAKQILEFAAEHLPPLQRRALAAWIEGHSFEELSARTGIEDERAAVRLVRAALATLRRRFGTQPE
jgi:DNA-directed RNA polymerase specialized sigma24 family protein